MKSLQAMVAAIIFGVLVHPLVGAVAKRLGDAHVHGHDAFNVIPLTVVPLVVLVGVGVIVADLAPRRPSVKWGLWTGAISAPALALAAQLYAWESVGRDPYVVITFMFIPTCAALASGALALVAMFLRWACGGFLDEARPPRTA
ncbi:hypothetical protein [Myxococcus qinghaiensis]|uniref:hypothetical protein n=1 Tax=Myxococcus qinghaiensis TaxID=2906758 RepID=UPI0020A70D5F|nr:hypothetical protein [Myxococcus qinghaiensis]MCP3162429.1 hypothetical protein [Myxococcus qinghaiensis]